MQAQRMLQLGAGHLVALCVSLPCSFDVQFRNCSDLLLCEIIPVQFFYTTASACDVFHGYLSIFSQHCSGGQRYRGNFSLSRLWRLGYPFKLVVNASEVY